MYFEKFQDSERVEIGPLSFSYQAMILQIVIFLTSLFMSFIFGGIFRRTTPSDFHGIPIGASWGGRYSYILRISIFILQLGKFLKFNMTLIKCFKRFVLYAGFSHFYMLYSFIHRYKKHGMETV